MFKKDISNNYKNQSQRIVKHSVVRYFEVYYSAMQCNARKEDAVCNNRHQAMN